MSTIWFVTSKTFTFSFLSDCWIKLISSTTLLIILKDISMIETFLVFVNEFKHVESNWSLFSSCLSWSMDLIITYYDSSLKDICFWSIIKHSINKLCSKLFSSLWISNKLLITMVILKQHSFLNEYSRKVSLSAPMNSIMRLHKTVIIFYFYSIFFIRPITAKNLVRIEILEFSPNPKKMWIASWFLIIELIALMMLLKIE